LVQNLPINLLVYKPANRITCLNSYTVFLVDTLDSFVRVSLTSRSSHFLEPNTQFGYNKKQFDGEFIRIESVQVFTDTFAFVYLPKPKENVSGTYTLQYRNKKDGPQPIIS
jgi:hypothetical protein